MGDDYPWLKVTSGKEAVQAVVRRVEDEFDFYARAFVAAPERFRADVTLTRNRRFLNSHLGRCLHGRLDFIQQELRKYCGDERQTMIRQLVSAQHLTALGDESGLARMERWLASGSDHERKEVFQHWALFGLALSDVPESRQRLVRQLVGLKDHDVKDIRRSAKQALEQMYYWYGDAAEHMPKRVLEYNKPEPPLFSDPPEPLDDAIDAFEIALSEAASDISVEAIKRLAHAATNGMSDGQANRLLTIIDAHSRSGAVQQDLARWMWALEARDAFIAFVGNLDGTQFQRIPLAAPETARRFKDLLKRMRQLEIGRPVTWGDIAHALQTDPLASGFGSMNKWVEYALAQAGVLVLFDALNEPKEYDLLLDEFVKASHGKLAIHAALQDRPRPTIDDSDSLETAHLLFGDGADEKERLPDSIEIEFVSGDRAYHWTARVDGALYDFPRLLATVNRALCDAEADERFVPVEIGNSVAASIFGHPAQIEKLAAEFNWRICRDPEMFLATAKSYVDNIISEHPE